MYTRKTFILDETRLRHLQELIKSPSFQTLCEMAEFDYNEWCKYWMSLIPYLNTKDAEDIESLEKEYYANEAIINWLEKIKQKWTDYIWTPV